MKKVIQPRITRVIQPEIAEYYCDRCGARCGIKENKKTTWYSPRTSANPRRHGTARHYCLATCHPADHPSWELRHVLNCQSCYLDAMKRQEGMHIRLAEAVLSALKGDSADG